MSKIKAIATEQLDYTISGIKLRYGITEIMMMMGSHFFKIVSYLLTFIIIFAIAAVVIPYIDRAKQYPMFQFIAKSADTATTLLRQQVPTKIKGNEVGIWIIIIGALIFKSSSRSFSEKLGEKVYFIHFKRKYKFWKSQQHIKEGSAITNKLDQTLNNLEKAKPKEREEILKQFIETKKKLDAMGRDLAFLSIDVVESTKMKEGEEKAFVEHDFREFKRFVDGVLLTNNVLKTTWTPDGVMSCFERVDQAVTAGRQVIIGLEAFNKNIKTMKRDFVVRGGVNSGFVYYNPNLPLEEIADRVIDIAGHFQKHAKPNSIWIAKPSIEPLATRDGFLPTTEVVDGYEVYEWKKQ
ncbi:MAG: guanylate cyclase [Bacteroidota bacterium]|nr:guanylate cyclase [Bacteroidota bacterium]